jgi:predicted ATPase
VAWLQTCLVELIRGIGERGVRGDVVIWTPDRRLRVFVSSTVGEWGELAEERGVVERAISALRLTPVLFELGARPYPPRELYRAYLAQSDVFVGLYWQRYGWVGPGMEMSGLEEEVALARAGGLPRLLYVKTPAPDREPRLAELLDRIKGEALDSYRYFRTPGELGRLVGDDLATLLSERFAATRPTAGAAPPPSSLASRDAPRPLPAATTSLVGRERAVEEVAGLLDRPGVRLVTLTGPGGIGKTRLAVAVAERVRDRFDAGAVFVPVAAVTRPEQVLGGIGRALRVDLAGTDSPLPALVEQLGDDRWLVVLDNLEQVLEVAGDLGELLARCPGVVILATSRTVLGLRAEWEYPVAPLPVPADPTGVTVAALASSPAVALFVDRARAVRPDFALTPANAAAVVALCQRLEGLPLAIELAAARTLLLAPDALLGRLATSLDALGTGAVDLPERQRTLRATVQWSVGLLEEAEGSLLETLAVFVDGWTVQAAARVAALDEDRALALSEALARHSLIQLDRGELGSRSRMLETIRAFVAERLQARPDVAEVGRRHAGYYRALAERADRPLRGVGQSEWLERLEAEAGNLAAAVGWYLTNDPAPLPHLFRVLFLFWELRDHWVRPAPGSPSSCPPPTPWTPTRRPSCCGRRWRSPTRSGATTRRRWPPASAWRRCWNRSTTPTYARCPSSSWHRSRRSRATSTAPCGGVGLPGAAPRPGRAVLGGGGRLHRRRRGDGRGPLRRRPAPSDRGARPGGARRQRQADRLVPGATGHPGHRPGPTR